MERQEFYALDPEERISYLAEMQMPAKEKATRLLNDCPTRNMDVTNFHLFAEDVVDVADAVVNEEGEDRLLEYFEDDVREPIMALQSALGVLANKGASGLTYGDKRALASVKSVMSHIRQGCKVFENEQKEQIHFHRMGIEAGEPDSEMLFEVAQDGYGHFRRMQQYAGHVANVVSSINRELGIQEPPERNRGGA